MDKDKLNEILADHQRWLGKRDGARANLSEANLSEADLSGANLSGANLRRADLSGADLSGADLSGANLSGANLRLVNLSGADIRRADLSGADLSGANLKLVNLRWARGLSINVAQDILCQFRIGALFSHDMMYVGCKQHTMDEWRHYIDINSEEYLDECKDSESHATCVKAIKKILKMHRKVKK